MRGLDLNQRPSGYEPDELPGLLHPALVFVHGPLDRVRGRCSTIVSLRSAGLTAVSWASRPSPGLSRGTARLEDLAATYSPVAWDAVPWALGVFTAEFGMGSGALLPAKATRSSSLTSRSVVSRQLIGDTVLVLYVVHEPPAA